MPRASAKQKRNCLVLSQFLFYTKEVLHMTELFLFFDDTVLPCIRRFVQHGQRLFQMLLAEFYLLLGGKAGVPENVENAVAPENTV